MRKLLMACILIASCKEVENKHKWKVEYIIPYRWTLEAATNNIRQDSCIYFIGNCCPFIDTAYAYKIGDTVDMKYVLRQTLIDFKPYKINHGITLDMGKIIMEKQKPDTVKSIKK